MRRSMIVAALLLIACKPKVRDLPVCPAMVAAERANESESRVLPVDVWFSVLVKNFNRTAMAPQRSSLLSSIKRSLNRELF